MMHVSCSCKSKGFLENSSAQFGFGYCDWNGRLSAVTNGSGFVVEYMYDIMDRVTNISWHTTSGATLGGFEYEYDAAGRIVSRRQEIGDPSQMPQMSQTSQKNYAYDDLDRLASDGDVSYTYDAAGNRMTRTEDGETITYTLGVGDRLASWNGGAYSYDAAGNVTHIERDGRPTLDLIWNSQYQLVSVSTNGVFAEGYAYDALCRRVSTRTLEGTTRHVYDDNWQVIADLDEAGDVIASYTWGDGIDNLLSVSIRGATYYPLTDIQGTVWGYVDSQNNVVARWQYDAWGNVVDEEFAPNAVALAAIRYRFQCREWSAATGLVNFRMRWYDPETGRWLSKGPIRLMGGINLYAFCDGNPICKSDWIGLCSDEDDESSWIDRVQTGIDGIGVIDPTPISDGANTVIYLCRGKWTDAGVPAIAMLPYLGDVAKLGKYGSKAVKTVRATRKGFQTAKEAAADAAKRGWNEVNGLRSHGQRIYTDGKWYYTMDKDAHKGVHGSEVKTQLLNEETGLSIEN